MLVHPVGIESVFEGVHRVRVHNGFRQIVPVVDNTDTEGVDAGVLLGNWFEKFPVVPSGCSGGVQREEF